MRGIRRLAALVAVTAVAFGFAVDRFESAAEDGCAQRAGAEPSYRVHAIAAPRAARPMAGMGDTGMRGMAATAAGPTTYRLRVVRDGRPVGGARVCLAAYMRGMSAMAVVDHATETAPGTYEVSLDFAMAGEWTARVVVDEPGRPPAAVAVDLVAR